MLISFFSCLASSYQSFVVTDIEVIESRDSRVLADRCQIRAQPSTQHGLIDTLHPLVREAVITNIRAVESLSSIPHPQSSPEAATSEPISLPKHSLNATSAEPHPLANHPVRRQHSRYNLSGATLKSSERELFLSGLTANVPYQNPTRPPLAVTVSPCKDVADPHSGRPSLIVKFSIPRKALLQIRSWERRQLAGFYHEITSSADFNVAAARKRWKEIRHLETVESSEDEPLDQIPTMSGALGAEEVSTSATCDQDIAIELDDMGNRSRGHARLRSASCPPFDEYYAESSDSEDNNAALHIPLTDPQGPLAQVLNATNEDFRVGLTDLPGMEEMAEKTRTWTIGPEQALCFVDESGSRLSQDQEDNGRKLLKGFVTPRGVERRSDTVRRRCNFSEVKINQGEDVDRSKSPRAASQSPASSSDDFEGERTFGSPDRINQWSFDCFKRMEEGRPYGTGVDGPADSDDGNDCAASDRWKNTDTYLAAAAAPGATRKDSEGIVPLLDSPCSLALQSQASPARSPSPSRPPLCQVQSLELTRERKASSSPRRFVKIPSSPVDQDPHRPACQEYPTWQCQDGKLSVVFSNDVMPGVYEIDIVASIKLTAPDAWHKQSFFIPGLPRLPKVAGQYPTGEIAFSNRRLPANSTIPPIRIDAGMLVECDSKDPNHIVGRFKLTEKLVLGLKTRVPIQKIEDFDFTTWWLGCLARVGDMGHSVQGYVRLAFNLKKLDIWADKVELKVVLRNARVLPSTFKVPSGQHRLSFQRYPQNLPVPTEEEAVITIQRDSQDMHHHLDILLGFPYVLDTVLPLPTFHGLTRRARSETILLTLPQPPYHLEVVATSPVRTWRVSPYKQSGQLYLRHDRLQIPDFVPPAVQEDPMVKFTQLDRVTFNALKPPGRPYPSQIARQLHMHIRENKHNRNGGLVLVMAIDVQVGEDAEILVIDPGLWEADFAFTNNIVDEEGNDWRETEDDYMRLFRSGQMRPGQIVHVEVNFSLDHESHIREECERNKLICLNCQPLRLEVPLPRIIKKMVLMASIGTDIDQCDLKVNEKAPESEVNYKLRNHNQRTAHIPWLTIGYTLSFHYDRPSKALKGKETPAGSGPVSHIQKHPVLVDSGTSTGEMGQSTAEDKPLEELETVPDLATKESETEEEMPEKSEIVQDIATTESDVRNEEQVELQERSAARRQSSVKKGFSWRQCLLSFFLLTCFCTFFQQGTQIENIMSWPDPGILRDLYFEPSEFLAAVYHRIPQSPMTIFEPWMWKGTSGHEQLALSGRMGEKLSFAEEAAVEPDAIQAKATDQTSGEDESAVDLSSQLHHGTGYSKGRVEQVRNWIDHTLGWKGLAS